MILKLTIAKNAVKHQDGNRTLVQLPDSPFKVWIPNHMLKESIKVTLPENAKFTIFRNGLNHQRVGQQSVTGDKLAELLS